MTARVVTPLACRIAGHDPDPFPRWNDGYYFARCRRCDAQLVRTAYGRWRLPPRGFRIVWSAVRPENLVAAPMLVDPADGLPEPPPQVRRPVSYVPDFMEDAKTDTSWRRHLPPSRGSAAEETGRSEAKPSRSDFARLIPPLRSTASADGGEQSPPARRAAVAIALLSLLLIVVVTILRDDGARATVSAQPQSVILYVTDGMTSCRALPSSGAEHIRYLVRGDPVRLVGRDGAWAAISYGGQQCWVSSEFLSDRPVD